MLSGQHVTAGQQLGLSGTSGCSTTAHLHFTALRKLAGASPAQLVDPYGWQPSSANRWSAYKFGAVRVPIWSSGNAPPLYGESDLTGVSTLPPPVLITRIRYVGVDDDHHANNEWVEVGANPSLKEAQ